MQTSYPPNKQKQKKKSKETKDSKWQKRCAIHMKEKANLSKKKNHKKAEKCPAFLTC